MAPDERKGWIFDIKRYAVHDGPGIRSTVFLKGCGLACRWCHNPESISSAPELLLQAARCIGCGACVQVCPNEVHRFDEEGVHHIARDRCVRCGRCVESCYAGALLMAGWEVTVEEVVKTLREDREFYETSGGGITLSGGEPFIQSDFTLALLKACKEEGFHTAVDTSGHVPWHAIEQALPYIDLVLYDLKHMDPEAHKQNTGAPNDRILINLKKISEWRGKEAVSRGSATVVEEAAAGASPDQRGAGVPIEIRIPVIPTLNDHDEFIEQAGDFLGSLDAVKTVRLLAYHNFAGSKYESVGRANTLPDVDSPTKESLKEMAGKLRRQGKFAVVGHE